MTKMLRVLLAMAMMERTDITSVKIGEASAQYPGTVFMFRIRANRYISRPNTIFRSLYVNFIESDTLILS
jgi:hypothetical protein